MEQLSFYEKPWTDQYYPRLKYGEERQKNRGRRYVIQQNSQKMEARRAFMTGSQVQLLEGRN